MDWRHVNEIITAGQTTCSEIKYLRLGEEQRRHGSLHRSQHELVFVFKSGKHHTPACGRRWHRPIFLILVMSPPGEDWRNCSFNILVGPVFRSGRIATNWDASASSSFPPA